MSNQATTDCVNPVDIYFDCGASEKTLIRKESKM
jgi:hypothetical protein